MKKMGVWIDSREALIVTFDSGILSYYLIFSGVESKPRFKGESSRRVKRTLGFDYESSQQGHYNEWMKKYIRSVAENLKDNPAELYITGPGKVRLALEKELLKAKHLRVLKNEPLHNLSLNQKLERISRFFESADS
ncbi:MAG: hypothetical protein ACK4RF_04255 [Cyclobacteriaceae bacterium]